MSEQRHLEVMWYAQCYVLTRKTELVETEISVELVFCHSSTCQNLRIVFQKLNASNDAD